MAAPDPRRPTRGRARRDAARDRLLRGLYAAGWQLAARVPGRVVGPATTAAARLARRRDGRHVQILRRNLTLATGRPVDDDLVAVALTSYLRTFYEVLALPRWSPTAVLRRVRTVHEQVLREAHAGLGAVVALPHSGNWDLAGAWACQTGMPVTTVAEQLGEAEFAAFTRFRARLGMEVLSHRDPAVLASLAAALRRGRLVCLLADRDLAGTGVPVRWAGHPVTMPAGPALVARRTGAALIPATCHYEGDQLVLTFADPVPVGPGRAGLVAATQQVADVFAAAVAAHPADWHLLQPFFAEAEADR